MRCNPWRWLWGLIPVAMLSWVAVLGSRESIEADLAQRVKTVLARSGLNWAQVKFDGREGTLSGRALEEAEPARAVEMAMDTWGVRSMINSAGLVEKVDRYHWKASRDGNRVRLEGHVPSDNARRDVMAAARAALTGTQVEDRMTLARGAPTYEPWLGGVGFGLKQLAMLTKGQIDLEALDLTVRGDAVDARGYESIKGALASALPRGVRLKQEAVTPPVVKPYVWTARLGRDRGLQIAGHLPGDPVRREMRSAVQTVLPGVRLDDRTAFGGGAPNGFAAAVVALLKELGNLEEGAAEIRDNAVAISGIAETQQHADGVRAAVRRLAGYNVRDDIKVRIPTVSPYVTAARFEGPGVVLTGWVPGDQARQQIVGVARRAFAGRNVADRLEIGLGQPPTWGRCLEIGFSALNQLGNGSLVLTDRRLEVVGTAPTEPEMQQLTEAIRDAAGADCVPQTRIGFDVARARAEEEARRRAEDEARQRQAATDADARRRAEEESRQRLATSDADARNRAEEEARQRQAAAETDARRRADEEARQRQAAAEADARRRAEEDARQRQAAAEAEARRRAEEDARQRQVEAEARRRQVAVDCQSTLRDVARSGVIQFQFAKADIDARSFATLNRVAEAANRCPEFKIEVEGHTDSDGAPDRNQRLSERRARAVLDYLVKAGVSADRIHAVGYGETRPVAENDSAENKARNRRIEFSVHGN